MGVTKLDIRMEYVKMLHSYTGSKTTCARHSQNLYKWVGRFMCACHVCVFVRACMRLYMVFLKHLCTHYEEHFSEHKFCIKKITNQPLSEALSHSGLFVQSWRGTRIPTPSITFSIIQRTQSKWCLEIQTFTSIEGTEGEGQTFTAYLVIMVFRKTNIYKHRRNIGRRADLSSLTTTVLICSF